MSYIQKITIFHYDSEDFIIESSNQFRIRKIRNLLNCSGEICYACKMFSYSVLEPSECNSVNRDEAECGVFERLMFPLFREAGFEPHVLFEVVVEGFICVPIVSIFFPASYRFPVVSFDVVVSMVSAYPFIVSPLVEEVELVFKVCVYFELCVMPVNLVPFVDFSDVSEWVVDPVVLWFVEEIGVVLVFSGGDVLICRVFSINCDLLYVEVDCLEFLQVHGECFVFAVVDTQVLVGEEHFVFPVHQEVFLPPVVFVVSVVFCFWVCSFRGDDSSVLHCFLG